MTTAITPVIYSAIHQAMTPATTIAVKGTGIVTARWCSDWGRNAVNQFNRPRNHLELTHALIRNHLRSSQDHHNQPIRKQMVWDGPSLSDLFGRHGKYHSIDENNHTLLIFLGGRILIFIPENVNYKKFTVCCPKPPPAPFWHSSSERSTNAPEGGPWLSPCCLVHVIIMNKV